MSSSIQAPKGLCILWNIYDCTREQLQRDCDWVPGLKSTDQYLNAVIVT